MAQQSSEMTDQDIKEIMRAIARANGRPLSDERIEADLRPTRITWRPSIVSMPILSRWKMNRRSISPSLRNRAGAQRRGSNERHEKRVPRRLCWCLECVECPDAGHSDTVVSAQAPAGELHYLTIREAANRLSSKQLSPVELIQATLARIDRGRAESPCFHHAHA